MGPLCLAGCLATVLPTPKHGGMGAHTLPWVNTHRIAAPYRAVMGKLKSLPKLYLVICCHVRSHPGSCSATKSAQCHCVVITVHPICGLLLQQLSIKRVAHMHFHVRHAYTLGHLTGEHEKHVFCGKLKCKGIN